MIRFAEVSVAYDDADRPTLVGVDLEVGEGELCLVVGSTGAGKSTLLGCVNGHVPHFTGGTVQGTVTVGGRDTRTFRPRDLADVVGVVGQDPARGFVTDRVTDELAYTMESLALPLPVMRRRVEDTLDLLGLADLRERPLATLSGGQQQRVAIGAALTANPAVLVLDEPTSALDPAAAEEVLAALHRLVHDVGMTVLLAEHRLERVLGYADSMIVVRDGTAEYGAPSDMIERSPVVPPVVELGLNLGWRPLALTVRDARRRAQPLRQALSRTDPTDSTGPTADVAGPAVVLRGGLGRRGDAAPPALRARGLVGGHGRTAVIGPVDVAIAPGAVTGLMGRNGSGKSTLLWTLAGALPALHGLVDVGGQNPRALRPADRRRLVALVPQQPGDLLYRTTVGQELEQADADAAAQPGGARTLLNRLAPELDITMHPGDLSEGQRLALALALQLVARPAVLLLDEPTRGLDYPAKSRLAVLLAELAGAGTSTLLATHDVEFAAAACAHMLILADGSVIADGPTPEVITASPTYAPSMAKVFAPAVVLTVADVMSDLVGCGR